MSSTPYSPPMENSPGNSAGTKLNLSIIDRKDRGKNVFIRSYRFCTVNYVHSVEDAALASKNFRQPFVPDMRLVK